MKKIVIVGAGPAGLTAAYELLKAPEQYEVVILEESQEIGGISRTVRYHGNRMDIGGHRFFSKDKRVMDWWFSLMPLQGSPSFDDFVLDRSKPLADRGPDPEEEDRVMLVRDRVSRIYYMKKFFDYPVSLKVQTLRNMGFLRTMGAGFSYLKSLVYKRKENSLEDFYVNRFGKVLYSMFFESYTEKVWGRHPSQMSAEWGAQRVKGLSITAVLKDMFHKASGKKDSGQVETSLIEQFYYPKFGPGQLWETAAAEIMKMGGEIRMGCPVSDVKVENGRVVSVSYQTENGKETVKGDVFLSSMPVKDLVASFSGTPVPADVSRVAAGLPYRDFITVGLLVDKLNLKNETAMSTLANIVPDCWIYIQEPEVRIGRLQIFNNWSPYLVEDPERTVWVGLEYFANEGDELWSMPEEEFISFAASELEKIGIISQADIRDSHLEHVKKAYPAYFDTYEEMDKVVEYMDGIENLFCIGRNGQHRYNNMDHSMLTAMEAVKNIRAGISSKDNVWNVNTEKEYHEQKKG